MSDWNAVLNAVSDLASLSLHDLPKRAPARPIDFPSPVSLDFFLVTMQRSTCMYSTFYLYSFILSFIYSFDAPLQHNIDSTPLPKVHREIL